VVLYAGLKIRGTVINPLVHSVLFKRRYKKLDVKKMSFNIQINVSFQSPESLATELTTFYLENKSPALMG